MHKRCARLSTSIALVLLFASSTRPAFSESQTVNLDPVQTLDVFRCLPASARTTELGVREFAVTDQGSYSLITGKGMLPVIAKMSPDGTCAGTLALPKRVQSMSVSSTGAIVVDAPVRLDNRPTQSMTFFHSLADLGQTMTLQSGITPYVLLEDGIYGVSRSKGALRRVGLTDTGLTEDLSFKPGVTISPGHFYDLATPGGSALLVLDHSSLRLYRVNLRTSQTTSFIVAAPELDKVLAKIPAARRPSEIACWTPFETAIISMAGSPEGDVYLGLGHFRAEAGQTYLHLDAGGKMMQAIVCRPPRLPITFVPSPSITYHAGRLYLLDARNGLVVAYKVRG